MRAVSLPCALLALVACAAKAPPATPRIAAPRAAPSAPPTLWPRLAEVKGWPAAAEGFPNDGHPGAGARATVRVSPDARPSYEHLVRDSALPDGALVAIFHDAGAAGAEGPVYVMEKTAGAWRFSSVSPDGRVDPTPGAAQNLAAGACVRCHEDGQADSLFGIPHVKTAPP